MREGTSAGEGLSISLHQETPIPLDAALECRRGEVLALVGPSGAGKTTILRAIAGLYRPKVGHIVCAGRVWFDGTTGVFVRPHRRAVGLVFQSYALFPHMTVLGNVEAALGHRPRGERRRRARELFDLVHLSGLEARGPAELSGGQQQRVAVARALAREPAVLLLDEPFSAVDKVTRGKLYRELAELRRSLAVPVVLVTHDFDEAARLADRMCLLHHGRVVQAGAPYEILARPATVEAAQLVDLKNLFEGKIEAHGDGITRIGWAGRWVAVTPPRPAIAGGSPVAWTVASPPVILPSDGRRTDDDGMENLVEGVVSEIAALSEATSIVVTVGGEHALSMTVPAHYARRTQLAPGVPVTIAIRSEGIHLVALEARR